MIRPPAVAGAFYPGDPAALMSLVDSLLADAAPPPLGGRLVAIQVPHAGYPYSGSTAAWAFRLLPRSESVTVVMIGPSHRPYGRQAAVYCSGAWRTPLGSVPVDEPLARAVVASNPVFAALPQAHAAEHSLEVQLPFLQRTLSGFRIVPVLLPWPFSYDDCLKAGQGIATASRNRHVLLLASTDLYHGEDYTAARKIDAVTTEMFTGFKPQTLYDALASGQAQACGGFAVVTTMVAARELGADEALLLRQTNSNDVMGVRKGYCVGYSATAFIDTSAPGANAGSDLDEPEQRELLRIARQTIDLYIREGRVPEVRPLTPRLAEKRGVFVTLEKHGALRGCIGYVESPLPLCEAVRDRAVQSATRDPRFRPVDADELGDIEIEVTVLSPMRPVPGPDSVVVGKHGVVIEKDGRAAVFLPQVPVEQGWSRDTYLSELCRKAGLPRNAWQSSDARLYVFTGQVFGERHRP